MGRHKEALKDLQKADSIKPDHPQILNNLGVVLSRLGKKQEAHDYYLKALRLQPDYNSAIYNLAVSFLERGDRQAAQRQLNSLQIIDAAMSDLLKKHLWGKFVINASEVKSKK
jgi:Flp pilus assembly protein TadD